jgi:hypothetical protein
MNYEEVEELYPCPDRRGIGYSGCSCTNNHKPDNRLVDCAAYGSHNYPATNCVNCPFRMQHDVNKRQLNG